MENTWPCLFFLHGQTAHARMSCMSTFLDMQCKGHHGVAWVLARVRVPISSPGKSIAPILKEAKSTQHLGHWCSRSSTTWWLSWEWWRLFVALRFGSSFIGVLFPPQVCVWYFATFRVRPQRSLLETGKLPLWILFIRYHKQTTLSLVTSR